MNYASSEAQIDVMQALPAPKPVKVHWSTIVFLGGVSVCALALVATIAGIPGRMGYNVDGPANRNKPSSMDPAKLQKSLDGNMKWIDQNSMDQAGAYVGLIKSINQSEAAIPAMVAALAQMNSSVEAIDQGLGALGESTIKMGSDLKDMSSTSASSAQTMSGLGGNIGFLSSTMVGLANATRQLTIKMSSIENKAGSIADKGTSTALNNAKDLNSVLPNGIPPAKTTEGEDYASAIQNLNKSIEGGGAQ